MVVDEASRADTAAHQGHMGRLHEVVSVGARVLLARPLRVEGRLMALPVDYLGRLAG